jgi:hypothetical protein
VNFVVNQAGAKLRPIDYWRLWLLDTVLVSAGILFFLALQYGTYEFFGRACAMALLPLIPVMVLVGGAGSTVFALTKVWIEKRSLSRPIALACLVGPALVVTLALVLLGAGKSSGHRLNYTFVWGMRRRRPVTSRSQAIPRFFTRNGWQYSRPDQRRFKRWSPMRSWCRPTILNSEKCSKPQPSTRAGYFKICRR